MSRDKKFIGPLFGDAEEKLRQICIPEKISVQTDAFSTGFEPVSNFE
mgnify:CR=1 FL=1